MEVRPRGMNVMILACEVVKQRGNRRVLLNSIVMEEARPVYHARVSCDSGKTWGVHRITREELVAVNTVR